MKKNEKKHVLQFNLFFSFTNSFLTGPLVLYFKDDL
jgi:hypothetical protein